MSDTQTIETTTQTPEQIAEAAFAAGDPDGQNVRIRAAWRDLSCSQSGPEVFRRVMYPGAKTTAWPDSDRLPAAGIRASERHCTTYADVPIGTIVQHHERNIFKGRRGRCSRSYYLTTTGADGTGSLLALEHRVLRSRIVDAVTLPSGAVVEVDRPER